MKALRIEGPSHPIKCKLEISGSKSISNRALLIKALCKESFTIDNLSVSDDSSTMKALLDHQGPEYDAHHAGTTFRFLTAYFSLKTGEQILTGSERMKQRPIGPLVDALRTIGADIEYLENEGYPPLRIKSFQGQKTATLNIASDISSQFISALCMIAPTLPQGLTLELEKELVSRPYLMMTLNMMSYFGVEHLFNNNTIGIRHQEYKPKDFIVESDWSSASYHYLIAGLLPGSKIELSKYFEESLQGDSEISKVFSQLGVDTHFQDNSIVIQSTENKVDEFEYDFIEIPDTAQTFASWAAGNGVAIRYNGLKTLAIKETDRVAALTEELSKLSIKIQKDESGEFEYVQIGKAHSNQIPHFETYNDHRMAMALAPLSIVSPVIIKDPKVVSKSYPNFWQDLSAMGFKLTEIEI